MHCRAGAQNPGVAGAAAQIAIQRSFQAGFIQRRAVEQMRGEGDNKTRRAITTLNPAAWPNARL